MTVGLCIAYISLIIYIGYEPITFSLKIFVLGLKERWSGSGSSKAGDDNNDVILHSQSTTFESTDVALPGESVEQLTVNRLPGEPLGMECDVIDSDVTRLPEPRVVVRRVVGGSPAERASGGNRGVEAGDEILSINGVRLSTVSRAELPQLITETPLTVVLLIRRQADVARLERPEDGLTDDEDVCGDAVMPGYALQTCKPSVIHEGFELRHVTFHKHAADKLGLQLERCSLDSHSYYQVFPLYFFILHLHRFLSRDRMLTRDINIAVLYVCLSGLPWVWGFPWGIPMGMGVGWVWVL